MSDVSIVAGSGPETDAALDVVDAFVFQRIRANQFAHLGGLGRGVGWAGIVEIDVNEESRIVTALETAQIERYSTREPTRVFGPYWSRHGFIVPVTLDQFVVLGTAGPPHPEQDEAARELSCDLVKTIEEVSPTKRLADELELQQAVEAVMNVDANDVVEAGQHIVRQAVEALSCDYGALWDADSETLATAAPRWTPDATAAEVRAAMRRLGELTIPACWQDAVQAPLPRPFTADDGLRSTYVLRVGERGALLLAHTVASPRGFTLLSQRIGTRISQTASMMLSAAAHRELLRRQATEALEVARTDALTELGNRLAWHEALETAFARHDRVGVIIADLNGLKEVNDRRGHAAGDELLVAAGALLRNVIREHDVAVRFGGDEFGLLIHGADEHTCAELTERIRQAAETAPCSSGLSIAIGCAIAENVCDLVTAERLADERMYADKRSRKGS